MSARVLPRQWGSQVACDGCQATVRTPATDETALRALAERALVEEAELESRGYHANALTLMHRQQRNGLARGVLALLNERSIVLERLNRMEALDNEVAELRLSVAAWPSGSRTCLASRCA